MRPVASGADAAGNPLGAEARQGVPGRADGGFPHPGAPRQNMGGGIPELKMLHLASSAIITVARYGEMPFFRQVAANDRIMEWL